jgi:extradiol dioxygenase family protein
MAKINPFHLAIPVSDLTTAKVFYENVLGCMPGRSTDQWADYSLFGHQLVLHEDTAYKGHKHFNEVDGKSVPIPHFGVVLDWEVFQQFSQRLIDKKIEFQIEPYLRFEGLPGEQLTMFFYDPSGNALEFKSFKHIDQLFAT